MVYILVIPSPKKSVFFTLKCYIVWMWFASVQIKSFSSIILVCLWKTKPCLFILFSDSRYQSIKKKNIITRWHFSIRFNRLKSNSLYSCQNKAKQKWCHYRNQTDDLNASFQIHSEWRENTFSDSQCCTKVNHLSVLSYNS